jgi:hypothetical protein
VFTSITPTRLLDTRRAGGAYSGAQEAEAILDVPVAGTSVVPAGATAVAVNLTIVDAVTSGYAQAYPTRLGAVDGVSTVNIETARQTLPNFAIVPIGLNGSISTYLPAGGHVLIDVLGYFTPSAASSAGRFIAADPRRVLDTRQSISVKPESLPVGWVNHKPLANEVVTVDFKPSSGLPATGVAAVVLTVTGTDATAAGFVTAFPAGIAVPDASVLNLPAAGTAANTVIVPLGAGGKISLFTSNGTHLLVDLQGYITDTTAPLSGAGRFVPIRPARSFDSRAGAAVSSTTITLANGVSLPTTGVDAVSFNATAAPGTVANGFLQLWPSTGTITGEFSNLNWTRPGQVVASGGIVRLGTTGALNARIEGQGHLIIDVNGYFVK